MSREGGGTTSPTLLRRVGDWRDHPAWHDLVTRYDPMVRRWCLGHGLDADTTDELTQRVWIELANRLRSFRYDPGRTFRGWLRRLCHSRAIDLLRERERERGRVRDLPPGDGPAAPAAPDDDRTPEGEGAADGGATGRSLLLVLSAGAQREVRSRVDPATWQAYWLIAVEDRSVQEAASSLGKSYAATFVAYKRVHKRLRDEGDRLLVGLATGPTPGPR